MGNVQIIFPCKGRLNANFQWRRLLIFGSVKHRERERESQRVPTISWLPSMTPVAIAQKLCAEQKAMRNTRRFVGCLDHFGGDTLLPSYMTVISYTIRRIPLFNNAGLHEVYHSVLFFSLHFLGPSNYQTWRHNAYSWHQLIRLRIWRTLHTQKSLGEIVM